MNQRNKNHIHGGDITHLHEPRPLDISEIDYRARRVRNKQIAKIGSLVMSPLLVLGIAKMSSESEPPVLVDRDPITVESGDNGIKIINRYLDDESNGLDTHDYSTNNEANRLNEVLQDQNGNLQPGMKVVIERFDDGHLEYHIPNEG